MVGTPTQRRLASRAGLVMIGAVIVAAAVALSAAGAFTDVSPEHAYSTAIQHLFDRNIVNGFDDGTFGPDMRVKRQQFAKMIVLTLELPVSEADVSPFTDVDEGGPGTLYPDNYVAVAAAKGITIGTAPGLFSPFMDITRAQVVTMIVRGAQNVRPGILSTPAPGFQGSLGDFSPAHGANMRTAEANGLLQGLLGFGPGWDPWAPASRGEVAQMLHNLLHRIDPGGSTTTSSSSTSTSSSTTSSSTTSTTLQNEGEIEIEDFAFRPANLVVAAGTTVVWRNRDAVAHDVVADDLSFQSGPLALNQTFQHTFDQPGVYTYHCAIHPLMPTGTVTVQ